MMRVFGTGPLPFQNYPYLKENGCALWWRGGDMMSPSGWQLRPEATAAAKPNWFNAIPSHVRRLYFSLPVLLFFTARRGQFGFYVGWKAFGADSDAYKDFPGVNTAEIYSGSVALTGFTARFTTNLLTSERV